MFLLIEYFYQKLIHFSALWFESKRPGLESQRRWRVSDLSRQHQGTGHASLQTHLLWRMRLDMVRQRTNMSNVQGTGETWDNHSFENNSFPYFLIKSNFHLRLVVVEKYILFFILQITEDPAWRDGATSLFVQLFWGRGIITPDILFLNDQAIWSNLAASQSVSQFLPKDQDPASNR